MAGYQPLQISGMQTGLVLSRENFLLPADAYPVLQNAYVWRERIKRKMGSQLLGRLQRNFTNVSIGNSAASPWSFNLFAVVIPAITETNKQLIVGSVTITIGATILIDKGDGTFTPTGGLTGTINYITGDITIIGATSPTATTVTFSYSPGLPVMGVRIRETVDSGNDETIFFDQIYAYTYDASINSFKEFLPGTTWTSTDFNFFWTTNYWTDNAGNKIFWATNYSGTAGDPIRYTNGDPSTTWVPFSPQIDSVGNLFTQSRCMLPFRGRMVAFNTYEGMSLASSIRYSNRIRWGAIGTPFTVSDPINTPPIINTGNINPNAWRDDIRGQGGFLDIPTSEDIISVGFVRDNLVIYCENSTWQLRYTGRSIAPFQIEKVNSELGSLGTFSSVQFDTSLVGFGDKGMVECDSYKSSLIDVKIPDLVYNYQHDNKGPTRVHGIRDFVNRLAYWIFPSAPANGTYPDQRLVYNYENDSWALFNDSYTAIGTYQVQASTTWLNTDLSWIECNFTWIDEPNEIPEIVAGNQQGYVEILNRAATDDVSLSISAITANVTTPTVITVVNHNLQDGFVIKISGIPAGTPFDNLNTGLNPNTGLPYNANNGIFGVIVVDSDNLELMIYNPNDDQFTLAQLDNQNGYVGGGEVAVRYNFTIQSKKFNYMEEGESIQLGFFDILMENGEVDNAAISVNVYLDYNDLNASNTSPENDTDLTSPLEIPDTFFNSVIPTTQSVLNKKGGTKFWQRVYCPTRANFITLEYTFSNAQMAGIEQELDVQIDSQILHLRRAGRLTQI